MFHLLGFLIIIIIAVLVIGLSIVGSVLRAIFGFGRRSSSHTRTYTKSSTGNQQQNTQKQEEEAATAASKSRHKKIFTKDEGEYVDFEEIK